MQRQTTNRYRGMTLIETLVAIGFFMVVSVALYEVYVKIIKTTTILNARVVAASLANEEFEILRNLPYASVGTQGGIPSGSIPHIQTLTRDGISFGVTTTIRNIDEVFDGTIGGTPNDLSPADNKLVTIEITCVVCQNFVPLMYTTHIAPKDLETASTNGALIINVFDANGVALPDATITIDNPTLVPAVHISDVSGVDGTLTIVDAPPAVGSYHIVVTKDGYSTDQSYPPNAIDNPNPTTPDATVVVQQITQVSFSIDKTSTLTTTTTSDTCVAKPGVTYELSGSKIIGTTPDVLKYTSTETTNSSGVKTITNLEWDTYTIALADSTYDLIGTNPLLSLGLLPDSLQDMQLIVAPKNPNRLLVVVRDQSTGLPITDANVEVATEDLSYDVIQRTGEGFLTQTDWSGGSDQEDFVDPTLYSSSDGNIDAKSPTGELKLRNVFGTYVSSGYLTSSTFDTNGENNFHQIYWSPTPQPAQAGSESVKFQVATNNDNATWDFRGRDGTNATYYTSGDNALSALLNGNRYFRYRVFLTTEDTSVTPSISDISFTFTTSCTPPGQVSFSGLSAGEYTVSVVKAGYQTYSGSVTINSNWQKLEVAITP
jgi:hypothetical protein